MLPLYLTDLIPIGHEKGLDSRFVAYVCVHKDKMAEFNWSMS